MSPSSSVRLSSSQQDITRGDIFSPENPAFILRLLSNFLMALVSLVFTEQYRINNKKNVHLEIAPKINIVIFVPTEAG